MTCALTLAFMRCSTSFSHSSTGPGSQQTLSQKLSLRACLISLLRHRSTLEGLGRLPTCHRQNVMAGTLSGTEGIKHDGRALLRAMHESQTKAG